MQSDLRAVLQYVPSFRGKVFVVVLDAERMSELAMAEALLDLIALQQVGVRLVLVSVGSGDDEIEQRLVDGDLKWQGAEREAGAVRAILERGQLAFVRDFEEGFLPENLVEFALSLRAYKVICLIPESPPAGVAISREEAVKWSGEGEMLLRRAGEVCERGIPRVHLLRESHQGVLMDELFSNEGVGVMVYADDYLSVRPISREDIAELLAMVGRSIRDAHLVPRTFEQIESALDDFLVLTIDENVVGCVALHVFDEENCAEVACLYVKQSHGRQGYGQMLVEAAEQRARELGLPWVFALSNRAMDFFIEKLGYKECTMEDIPMRRQEMLRASGRSSIIMKKKLGID